MRFILLTSLVASLMGAQPLPVLTVCEILSKPAEYHGKRVIAVGVYQGWFEGSILSGNCTAEQSAGNGAASNTIWLDRESRFADAPALATPDLREYLSSILAKRPSGTASNLELVLDGGYSDLPASVYGRFETNRPPPGTVPFISPKGFGHLNAYPARLVCPPHASWSLVPPDRLPALKALDQERAERLKLATWHAIRISLRQENRQAWFVQYVKGRLLTELKGTILEADPIEHPDRLLIAIEDSRSPEIELRLDGQLKSRVVPGSVVEFEGVALACAFEPFLLKVQASLSQLRISAPRPQPRLTPATPPK